MLGDISVTDAVPPDISHFRAIQTIQISNIREYPDEPNISTINNDKPVTMFAKLMITFQWCRCEFSENF